MWSNILCSSLASDEVDFHGTRQYEHPALRFAQAIPLLRERLERCDEVSDVPSDSWKVVATNLWRSVAAGGIEGQKFGESVTSPPSRERPVNLRWEPDV
jgi:hypothetical protein